MTPGAAFARLALRAFEATHYEIVPGVGVAATGGETLFVSAGIQPWRAWTSITEPDARCGVQWCLRMNRLSDVGRSAYLTSFCMLTALRRGPVSRSALLLDLFGVFQRLNIDTDRLAFVVAGEGDDLADAASADALRSIGVRRDRWVTVPRRWAAPFGPAGPAGPNLFVLYERSAVPCGTECSPACDCGRYFHFWNCEFLDFRQAGKTVLPADPPVVDSAGSLERLWSVVTGERLGRGPLLAPIAEAVAERLPGAEEARTAQVTDHLRSVVLLLCAGVRASGQGRGHVLRRLARRAISLTSEADADPATLLPVLEIVEETCHDVATFGSLPAGADTWLLDEIGRAQRAIQRSEHVFRRQTAGTPAGCDVTGVLFRLRAECGVPWWLLRQWAARHDFCVDDSALSQMQAAERVNSRNRCE